MSMSMSDRVKDSSDKKSCKDCRFHTFDDEANDFVCHNEDSPYFGKKIDHAPAINCNKVSPHKWQNMTHEEALDIIFTRSRGCIISKKLPDRDTRPFLAYTFESNRELEDYRDAHMRLFIDYMNKKHGDTKESDGP